jgi:hypothetical protein
METPLAQFRGFWLVTIHHRVIIGAQDIAHHKKLGETTNVNT